MSGPELSLERRFLETPYERLRPRDREGERELAAELAAHGQAVAIVVVAAATEGHFVVIDGHRRLRALEKLGYDLVRARVLEMSAAEALVEVRARQLAPRLSALEEGWLVRELIEQAARTPEEVARIVGRSKRWVLGRLALARGLPTALEPLVASGRLSVKAATGLVIPVAACYPTQAIEFAQQLAEAHFSGLAIDELARLFRRGSIGVQQMLVADPMRLLRAHEENRQTVPPRLAALDLHEKSVVESLEELTRLTRGARARLEAMVATHGTSAEFEKALAIAWARLSAEQTELQVTLELAGLTALKQEGQGGNNHDTQGNAQGSALPAPQEELRDPADRPGPRDVPYERDRHSLESEPRGAADATLPDPDRAPGVDPGAPYELRREPFAGGRGALGEARQARALLDGDAVLPQAQAREPLPPEPAGR